MSPVRISRPALLGVYASGLLTALVLFGCGVAAITFEDPDLATPAGWMLGTGVFTGLATVVLVMAVLIHRMWKAIQCAGARFTPGKAVGLCFVPLFNIYWNFQAIATWATEYNRIIDERKLDLPRMSEGLAQAVPALMAMLILPGLLLIPMVVLPLVLVPILVSRVCRQVNAFADVVEQGLPEVIPASKRPPPVPVQPKASNVDTKFSTLAVVSLVFSILGFFTLGLGGLIGAPLGLIALLRIRRSEKRLRGIEVAIIGLVVGVFTLLFELVIAASIVVQVMKIKNQ